MLIIFSIQPELLKKIFSSNHFCLLNFCSRKFTFKLNEIILNIYLIINSGIVEAFKVVSYEMEGGDDRKIEFLKSRVKEDYKKAVVFDAPTDKNGEFMSYNKFHKLEKRGLHFQLFEDIFQSFNVAENPLICVTPVVDGEIYSE